MVALRRAFTLKLVFLLLVLGLSGALNFVKLGRSSLFSDEAIYGTIAHNVVENGDWYPLMYKGLRYSWKPPLAVWPVAVSFSAFGESEFSDRLPSGLMATLTVGLVFLCCSWMLGPWSGLLAALLFATCSPWLEFHGARNGVAEPLLCFLLISALASYHLYKTNHATRWLIAACVAVVLSGLCKGLLGPLVVFVSTLCNEIVDVLRSDREHREERAPATGLRASPVKIPFLLLFSGASVYLMWGLENALHDPGFLGQLYRDTVVRVTSGIDPGHVHGRLFYWDILSRDLGYLWIPLACGLYAALAGKQDDRGRALRLTGIYAMVFMALIHLSASKLSWYMTPAMPAIAVLVAVGMRWILSLVLPAAQIHTLAYAALGLFVLAPRLSAAWALVNQPPMVSDMQRIVDAIRHAEGAHIYLDSLGKYRPIGEGFEKVREWNEYYIQQLDAAASPLPEHFAASGCDVVLTRRAQELISREPFAKADVVMLKKYDPGEIDLAVLDLCQGRIRNGLRSD